MNETESVIKILDAQGAHCGQCSREPGDSLNDCRDCATVLETYAHALEVAGLLMPDVQVVRTVSELEALDPDAVLVHGQGLVDSSTKIIHMIKFPTFERPSILPAVVIATGEQVRAAREAMEQEHDL